jgi:DNA repair ATPase RecN
MSKTRTITTLDDLKNDQSAVITFEQYTELSNKLIDLTNKLKQKTEDFDIDELEIEMLKSDIETIATIGRNYKKEIIDQQKLKEISDQNNKILKENKDKLDITIKNKIINNSKKTKEELANIALTRNQLIKDKYKDFF